MRTFRALALRAGATAALAGLVAGAMPVLAEPLPTAPKAPPPAAPAPAPAAAAKADIDLDAEAAAASKAARARSAKAGAGQNAKRPAKPVEPELPSPDARMWLTAPTPTGPWTLRIDNEGARPIRVPADIRLLRLEVDPVAAFVAPGAKGAAKTKAAASAKKVVCAVPGAMRPDGFPERSALILKPGESYVESFDPRLFCFGKEAASLTGAAQVRARFGWEPGKGGKTAPTPPFAAQGVDFPAVVGPQKALFAPTLVLSYDRAAVDAAAAAAVAAEAALAPPPKPSAAPVEAAKDDDAAGDDDDDDNAPPKPKFDPKEPIVDQNAARLEVGADSYVDASDSTHIPITVTITNVGHRATPVVFRSRMLAFHVDGPDGAFHCDAAPPQDAIARESFQTMAPGGKLSLTVLLGELCSTSGFRRPGLYKVTPTVFANEAGAALGMAAYTGVVRTKVSTLVRIQAGPEPFYARLPRPTPTPGAAPATDP